MKCFITGISGFAGSHLAEFLISKGYNVNGFIRPNENLANLNNVIDNISLKIGDLCDRDSLFKSLLQVQPKYIFHLAGEASAHKSFQFPNLFYEINVIGTVNLLEAVIKAKINPRIILVTSSEIYGFVKPEQMPLKETTSFHPDSPYAVSKVTLHYLANQYYRNYNLDIVEARAFNHIGPRQLPGFVVPDFCKQIAQIIQGKKKPAIYVGKLDDKRDFVDVHDMVRAYYMLALKAIPPQAYNICSGKSVAINHILNELIRIAGIPVKIIKDPQKMRPSIMPEIRGDNSKIIEEIGWQPKITLEESLTKSLDYFIEHS